jgi:hypothetical protein
LVVGLPNAPLLFATIVSWRYIGANTRQSSEYLAAW